MIDVPDAIVEGTNDNSVRSTHLAFPETAEELAAKTRANAELWEPVANDLWEEMPEAEKRRFGKLTKVIFWGNRDANQSDHQQKIHAD